MIKLPDNKYLGKLCKGKHDWENTGKSLRYFSSRICIYCALEYQQYWRKANSVRLKTNRKKYQKTNQYRSQVNAYQRKKSVKKKRNAKRKVEISELSTEYIKNQITKGTILKRRNIPTELIKLKTIHLKIKRRLRETLND